MSQYSAWCFTLNNYTEENIQNLLNLDIIKYIIFGKEIGEKEKTPHLQGYFELFKKKTHTGVKKALVALDEDLRRVRFDARIGSQKQAINYCKKGIQSHDEWKNKGIDGPNYGLNADVTEKGTKAKQGARKDLDKVRYDALDNGLRSISRWANPQQVRVAEKFLTYNEEPRHCPGEMYNYYIYGKSEAGKTFAAIKLANELSHGDYYMFSPHMKKWFEGYDGHKVVIINDVNGKSFEPKFLLSLIDCFEHRVENKGGSRQMLATTFIITSILSPKKFWVDTLKENVCELAKEPYRQFERRIQEIWKMEADEIIHTPAPIKKLVARSGDKNLKFSEKPPSKKIASRDSKKSEKGNTRRPRRDPSPPPEAEDFIDLLEDDSDYE
nr:putative replication associated protein [Crucivirus sp.]